MQVIYRHFDILSLGIFIGPIVILIGLLLLKKSKRISKILIASGVLYFALAVALSYRFVQSEKELVQLREREQKIEGRSQ
ncbi:hypothetical protein [Bdellovibrio bacteriovorus]|uniref:hypothetical protein n=1 Tax=Bdellovibrio bacteriovorus TaxID=959 RepID=UPI003AA8F9DA